MQAVGIFLKIGGIKMILTTTPGVEDIKRGYVLFF
jgi:hypothetical protein